MQDTALRPEISDDGEGTLPVGTRLQNGKYTIAQFLVRGGFGLTYIAHDDLNRSVLIKECYAENVCQRHDLAVVPQSPDAVANFRRIKSRFTSEAQLMARAGHPNVPTVHQIFNQNNTLYLVTDLVAGMDLLNVSLWDPKRLTPKLIRKLLDASLLTMAAIHENNVLHRDLSPDNLVLDHAGGLHIIDFGNASDRADAQTPVVSTKSGYAPPEYYVDGCHTDTASDIYGLAATFHQIITGHAPPDAQLRQSANDDPYRPLAKSRSDFDVLFLGLIDDALSLDPNDRPSCALGWRAALQGDHNWAIANDHKPDPLVERVVSTLVAQNTLNVEAAVAPTPVAPPPTAPRRLVDLFGDPIDDFDAWLAKQKEQLPQHVSIDCPKSRISGLFHSLTAWISTKANTPDALHLERKSR